MPPTLTPARERFHPYSVEEVIHSNKLTPKKAARLLSMLTPALTEGESVAHLAPASSFNPLADYVAVTNTRFYAGTSTGPKLSLPLTEIEFGSRRNLNSWSTTPDTLVVNHGNDRYTVSRVPTPDHAILQEFADRARLIARVAHPQIFEQLAAAREQAHPHLNSPAIQHSHPAPAAPTSPPAPNDMAAAIAQLKQLSELRDAGALTSEEFNQAKSRLGF